MAIEFQLLGDIALSSDLRDSLRASLGAGVRDGDVVASAVEFELVTPLVLVSAFHSPSNAELLREHGMRGDAVVFFRVRDKSLLNDAVRIIIVCVGAVLGTACDDALFLLNGETPLLARRGDDLEVFLWADESEADFWHVDGRLALLSLPCRPVRKRRSSAPSPVASRASRRRRRG